MTENAEPRPPREPNPPDEERRSDSHDDPPQPRREPVSPPPPVEVTGTVASPETPPEPQAPPPAERRDGQPPANEPEALPPIQASGKRLAVLTLGALGVVYGDIGTSPLYAFRECFSREHGLAATTENVYGVLSLILWAILLVVVFKYITHVLRADNRGEGGTLALLALLLQRLHRDSDRRARATLTALGLFGAALLYGDGMITPPVSVLGAMEGLLVVTPSFEPAIVPVTFGILLALFVSQRKGTSTVGAVFGPVCLVWFTTIGLLGATEVFREPAILRAINPLYAVRFFAAHGAFSFVILGTVVLAITGAEALYADMGHFGKRPIRLAFFVFVFPALLLNYFGQGALVLRDPAAAANPFYLLAPAWFRYPLIAIATAAAIVASQAMISGAFSITQQAVQLGYIPRVNIHHTSQSTAGQIYIPEINWILAIGSLMLLVTFRSAGALAAAYGIAVTGTMVVTSTLFAFYARERWRWPMPRVIATAGVFMLVDLVFFGSNLLKLPRGGWIPLLVAFVLFSAMTTWKKGRELVQRKLQESAAPADSLLPSLESGSIPRVAGTAVFLTSAATGIPVVLMHYLKHSKVLHEEVIILTIRFAEVPHVPETQRITLEALGYGVFRLVGTYGFMERPDVRRIMELGRTLGLRAREGQLSYFLGRERVVPLPRKAERQARGIHETRELQRWRRALYAFLSRNAVPAADYFNLPPNKAVELGALVHL